MYDRGDGVPEDKTKAIMWYEKTAENGHAVAMNNLGYMYDHGDGVPKDEYKANLWYEKALENWNDDAMNNIGFTYDHPKTNKTFWIEV